MDQLPSVGAGEVLRDPLAAERLPRVRLTKVFRQAQQSGVVTNAHRINAGQPPITQGLDDFFLFAEDDPEQVADLVVEIVANRRLLHTQPRERLPIDAIQGAGQRWPCRSGPRWPSSAGQRS